MEIKITVEGGVIQNVENIPSGVTVVVKDFDTDGTNEKLLETDEKGNQYVESRYEAEENARGVYHTWVCPECGNEEEIEDIELQEIGDPMCCDVEMEQK